MSTKPTTSFARLLRKRLKGLAPEQVDLAGLVLTHYRVGTDGALVGVGPEGKTPTLDPTTDNGLRDAKDREKKYLAELIEKLNAAFGKGISEQDKVALAIHISEKLRGNAIVMAQVQNNPREQAMKANLPQAAIQAIVGAMQTHETMATKLLSDEATREIFLSVVYELLKKDSAGDLLKAARG